MALFKQMRGLPTCLEEFSVRNVLLCFLMASLASSLAMAGDAPTLLPLRLDNGKQIANFYQFVASPKNSWNKDDWQKVGANSPNSDSKAVFYHGLDSRPGLLNEGQIARLQHSSR
jgi:hypothetical protein